MQEETNEKTIALYIKTGKLTAQQLQKAMKALLAQMKKQHDKQKIPHGKQTLKQLADRWLLFLRQLLCGKLLESCGQCVRVPSLEKHKIAGRGFGAGFL